VINEILADPPAGADVNGDGTPSPTGDEFVELVNVSKEAVALTDVQIRVGSRTVGLGARCLPAGQAFVVFGSQGLPGLANSGAIVQLLVKGDVAQTISFGPEGAQDASLVLQTELDPDSGWVLHSAVHQAPYSPGTCGDGGPFPDCRAPTPITVDATTPDTGDSVQPDVAPPPCDDLPRIGDLVINEILADPGTAASGQGNDANGDGVVSSTEDEFVEVVNVSGKTLLVQRIGVVDASGRTVRVTSPSCLVPGQALVFFGALSAPRSVGGALMVGGTSGLSLNNGGDTVRLIAADDAVLAEVSYGSEADDGQSIVRGVELDPNSPFVAHTVASGSGGARMSPGTCSTGAFFPDCGVVAPDPGPEVVGDGTGGDTIEPSDVVGGCAPMDSRGLVIHELNRAPAGRDFNGDGSADVLDDEFAELVNATTFSVELQGVELWVGAELRHTFGHLCLKPGEAVVVFGGGSPGPPPFGAQFVVASTGSLRFNDTGVENVRLKSSSGVEIDSSETTQTEAQAGKSWARLPDCTRSTLVEHPPLGQWASSAGRMSDGEFFSRGTCAFPAAGQ